MIRNRIVTVAALCAAIATPAVAGEVTVTLTEVRPDAGDLLVSLQTKDDFMSGTGIAQEMIANPQDGTVTVSMDDIPDGDYALMVWHDIDGDGTFSMGPMGPTDGWSMIGASELRDMPSWEAQSFTVDGSTTITEAMVYPEAAQ